MSENILELKNISKRLSSVEVLKEVNTLWQEFMSPFIDANARPDETFVELEEYFHPD